MVDEAGNVAAKWPIVGERISVWDRLLFGGATMYYCRVTHSTIDTICDKCKKCTGKNRVIE